MLCVNRKVYSTLKSFLIRAKSRMKILIFWLSLRERAEKKSRKHEAKVCRERMEKLAKETFIISIEKRISSFLADWKKRRRRKKPKMNGNYMSMKQKKFNINFISRQNNWDSKLKQKWKSFLLWWERSWRKTSWGIFLNEILITVLTYFKKLFQVKQETLKMSH